MKKKITMPSHDIRALIVPTSIDVEKRTVDVVWTTGQRVLRYSWMDGPWYEELEVKNSAIRMERLNNGAPVLKDHRAVLDSMVGVVLNAKVEDDKEGSATLKFSKQPDADRVFQDVIDGIVKNVSVGYARHTMVELAPEKLPNGQDVRVFRVTDWEPLEISFLPVQADMKAQVRSESMEKFECEIETYETRNLKQDESERTSTMGDKNKEPVNTDPVNLDDVRRQAIEAERLRVDEIRTAGTQAKMTAEFIDGLIKRGVSSSDARKEILAEMAKIDAEKSTRSTNVQVGEDNKVISMRSGIENALLNRISAKKFELNDSGKNYRLLRMFDMAKELLTFKGIDCRKLTNMEIATRALHTTSDFPEILANVANKTLRDAYQEAPQTFWPFTRTVEVPDFKEISRAQLGDAPALKEKKQSGEYEYGTISESAEKYSVKTYGRAIGVNREMLINDDLDAFSRLAVMFGRAAANLESDLVWNIIIANANMSDGNALFSVAHLNYVAGGGGAAPSVLTLGTAREAMRLQKSLDGNYLNIVPRYLVVPANLETVADQLVALITPDQAGNVNPFGKGGKNPLMPVAEPRLDADSTTAWYLFADTAQIDILELAYLMGETGPVIDSMIDFDTDGLKVKCRHTVGAKAIDWRGMYCNEGV